MVPRAKFRATIVWIAVAAAGCAQFSGVNSKPRLPEALNKIKLMDSDVVVIINHDPARNVDAVQMRDSVIEPPNLRTEFRNVFHGKRNIIIEAAPDVRYHTVLTVMDAASSVGFYEFGLANHVRGKREDRGVPAGFEKVLPPTGGPYIDILMGPVNRKNAVKLRVTKADHVWIDGKPSRGANLYTSIAAAIARHRSRGNSIPHISLLVDKDASWGLIIQIMDASREAGDDDVEFLGAR